MCFVLRDTTSKIFGYVKYTFEAKNIDTITINENGHNSSLKINCGNSTSKFWFEAEFFYTESTTGPTHFFPNSNLYNTNFSN